MLKVIEGSYMKPSTRAFASGGKELAATHQEVGQEVVRALGLDRKERQRGLERKERKICKERNNS